jgi:hypothetical protein
MEGLSTLNVPLGRQARRLSLWQAMRTRDVVRWMAHGS